MSHINTCPHCSRRLDVPDGITDKTSICPHCRANVDNAWQIQAANINTDVKRGVSVGSIVLAVLIGLCILGITMAYFAPHGEDHTLGLSLGEPRLSLLWYFYIALDVLVSIAIIRVLVRRGIFDVRAPFAGKVFGIAFLSCGTIVATVIFFFFTCLFLVG